MNTLLPTLLTLMATVTFFTLERVFPGRQLPNSKGWYVRAVLINLCQFAITMVTNRLWIRIFGGLSVFHLSSLQFPAAEGFLGWFVGTFFFYWWHRIRHLDGFWHVLHQVHHSPKRIEVLTSFYKHPLEILADSTLSAIILYVLLGCSMEGAFWFNFFAATGEYFYHSNLKMPAWVRYLIQTPELHSIHHQLDVHRYNYADIPLWDRLFGTYRDTTEFVAHCGFPRDNERKLLKMLAFRDVYRDVE